MKVKVHMNVDFHFHLGLAKNDLPGLLQMLLNSWSKEIPYLASPGC